MNRQLPPAIALIACLAGCPNNGAEPAGTTSLPEITAPTPHSSSSARAAAFGSAQYPDRDLPVAADFEEQAERQINGQNYQRELERIEANMRQGGAASEVDGGPTASP